MKKLLISFLSVAFFVSVAHAQVVNMTNGAFNKETKPAFVMELDYSKKITEEAVEKRFKDDKQKGKSSSGMTTYANTTYSAMGIRDCNVYTKIDGNSKNATLYIFVQEANGNFITSGSDQEKQIKKFMLSLADDVKALDLEYQIAEQKKIWEKSEKEYDKLVDKKTSLEKELKNTENDIQKADTERKAQKSALEELEAKRGK